jgi:HEAT repeat protein
MMCATTSKKSPRQLFTALKAAEGHAERAPLRKQLERAGALAVPVLLDGLASADDFTRWEAVNLLGILAPDNALDAVVEYALGENERHAKWRAFWAVSRFNRHKTRLLLHAAVSQPEADRRWRAALMLSMMGDQTAGPVLLAGLDNCDRWIQWEALGAIKALGIAGAGARVAKFLQRDQPRHLRQEAVLALGAIPDGNTVGFLVKALNDHEPQLRWRASMVLARRGTAALQKLRARLRRERDGKVIHQLRNDIKLAEEHYGSP